MQDAPAGLGAPSGCERRVVEVDVEGVFDDHIECDESRPHAPPAFRSGAERLTRRWKIGAHVVEYTIKPGGLGH